MKRIRIKAKVKLPTLEEVFGKGKRNAHIAIQNRTGGNIEVCAVRYRKRCYFIVASNGKPKIYKEV